MKSELFDDALLAVIVAAGWIAQTALFSWWAGMIQNVVIIAVLLAVKRMMR